MAHLQGIAQFSKEVVDKLAIFGTQGSPEMMSEVLKAAANKMQLTGKTSARVKVSVQGWGDSVSIDVAGKNLQELTGVAQTVGARFLVQEVEFFRPPAGIFSYVQLERHVKIIQMNVSHQKEMLDYTGLHWCATVHLMDISLPLLKVSKRWKVGLLTDYFFDKLTSFPTEVVAAGHIDQMNIQQHKMYNLDTLKRIWEITVKMTIFGGADHPMTTVGGGRGENPDEDWQRVLNILEQ